MNHLRKIFVLALSLVLTVLAACSTSEKAVTDPMTTHPRIMLLKGEEEIIKQSISANPTWQKMHDAIVAESDKIIDQPPLERTMIGRRLLGTSREVLRRVFYLSYSYRMTGADKYVERAEKEMLAAANFTDWNPTHFLDVGEMTMALAIGYDWLFDKLSAESRNTIREAILVKGLEPSFDKRYNGFLRATHNWNQVCNAGMLFGALAIYEDHPEISTEVIERAINTIPLAKEDYKPDGAYPEGYGYWNYGTTFNVLFLSALDKAWPQKFDYSDHAAFLNGGKFITHMVGPTGSSYNWGDNGAGAGLSPAMFWFAERNNDPKLLWNEKSFLDRDDYSRFTGNRVLPALMIWGKDIAIDRIAPPDEKVYMAQGPMPLCLMRTSWTDPNAIYLGFKGGSPSVNHGHMDIGSFIMESDGVRWAIDLGAQSYESLESRGMSIFGRTQDAVRWTILRLNNYIHNTLTVNRELQRVSGYAKIDKHSDNLDFSFAITDMSSVYENQLAVAKRGAGIVDQKYVVVRDEVQAGPQRATIRWQFLTSADVTITGKNTATLSKDGKQLHLRVDEPANISVRTWSSQPTTDYDAPNPGTILVGFETTVPANATGNLQVKLIPASSNTEADFNKNLADW
jgi:hypothetical protein